MIRKYGKSAETYLHVQKKEKNRITSNARWRVILSYLYGKEKTQSIYMYTCNSHCKVISNF